MRQLDVLDLSAKEHRRIHAQLAEMVGRAEPPTPAALDSLAGVVSRHEAADRLLLHPLLMQDVHGHRLAIDRRAEQALITSLLGGLLRTAARPEHRPTGLRLRLEELERVLVGHMDREEIEDFPHLRRLTTHRERLHLARTRRQLQRGPVVAACPASDEQDEVIHLDPLGAAEAEARQALEGFSAPPPSP
jgi:hypothetical protein